MYCSFIPQEINLFSQKLNPVRITRMFWFHNSLKTRVSRIKPSFKGIKAWYSIKFTLPFARYSNIQINFVKLSKIWTLFSTLYCKTLEMCQAMEGLKRANNADGRGKMYMVLFMFISWYYSYYLSLRSGLQLHRVPGKLRYLPCCFFFDSLKQCVNKSKLFLPWQMGIESLFTDGLLCQG